MVSKHHYDNQYYHYIDHYYHNFTDLVNLIITV